MDFAAQKLSLRGKKVTFQFRTREDALGFFRIVKDAGELRVQLSLSTSVPDGASEHRKTPTPR